ncbi:ABC transporter ATP-binding protein [Ostreibacterium oceani]|uniref:ATP-binding cassette domain-containing protein n=1 Tax=Ostreibacterium oceani TaxID=2654998 RepID=A0A6N7EVX0_9GAMM|nr:ABC transporter ATP-binding protein [Ostreibacterium oceani]MPV85700.1 ATP-binding cassette domain-containing protein [Ostreibacterium oceani]
MNTSQTHLVAKNLSQIVTMGGDKLVLLEQINLTIAKGESIAIVGVSGSGKSTLLGLLAGLESATEGDIYLADQHLTSMNEDQRAHVRASHVGFIFQSFQLLPNLTALENVALPLEILNRSHDQQLAKAMLTRVGLANRLHHYPKQLSGGEQQRVAIARAFVTQPDILFADEPTGNLDQRTSQSIEALLFELNQENQTTLVLVTHDNDLAAKCQRVVNMHAGKLSELTEHKPTQ